MRQSLKRLLVLALCAAFLPFAGIRAAASEQASGSIPEKITVTGSHSVAKGFSIRLKASVSPSGAPGGVTWKSSDPEIAQVSKKGEVTGLKAGTVTITAVSVENPKVHRKWKITVMKKAVQAVRIIAAEKKIRMGRGRTLQLTAKADPDTAAQEFRWSSSDPETAEVSAAGKVKARKAGKVTITCTAADGSGKKAKIRITVEEGGEPDPVPAGRYYALLVGNGDYRVWTKLSDSMNHNIRAVSNALKHVREPWQITVKKDLTGVQIGEAIEDAFRGAAAEDTCLFFYTGHGNDDPDLRPGALLGIGYDAENGVVDALEGQQLAEILDRTCPGKVIVILDSCGSGSLIYEGDGSPNAFVRGAAAAFSGRGGRLYSNTGELLGSKFTVLAAAEHGDYGWIGPVSSRVNASLFCYSLIRALGCSFPAGAYSGTMPADTDGDNRLTLEEVFRGANRYLNEYKAAHPDAPTQVFQRHGDPGEVLFTR